MNYFNYYTEIEEHFQKARGTGIFLLSPLDWALIESWKSSGLPLEAVLRGIDAAFEKWRGRKSRTQKVNSLAYCAQAVMAEAERAQAPRREAPAPFPLEAVRAYLAANAAALRSAGEPEYIHIAAALDELAGAAETHYQDLEQLERRLASLEDRMLAAARLAETQEQLLAARERLDQELRPYRGKMTAAQLALLEKQYLEKALLESRGLPRLSLFYMR